MTADANSQLRQEGKVDAKKDSRADAISQPREEGKGDTKKELTAAEIKKAFDEAEDEEDVEVSRMREGVRPPRRGGVGE